MKRITYVGLLGAILAGLLVTGAGAQSEPLGDYARSVRKDKKPSAAKQFDNDNLPREDNLSVVGKATDESASTSADAQAMPADGDQSAKADGATKKADGSPGESADARQKMYEEWSKKIATQKSQVDLLSRELDVVQREYRLRAAAMYADAGNRLRNSGSWDKEDAQYKDQVDQKQKAVDAAKKQLDDVQEQARKAGVPSGMRE